MKRLINSIKRYKIKLWTFGVKLCLDDESLDLIIQGESKQKLSEKLKVLLKGPM